MPPLTVSGRVLQPGGSGSSGASVTLRNTVTDTEEMTTSGAGGAYAFTNVEPGRYVVLAVDGVLASTEEELTVASGNRKQDLQLRTQKQPVIFVPGMMGSTTAKTADMGAEESNYPTLDRIFLDPEDLFIFDPLEIRVPGDDRWGVQFLKDWRDLYFPDGYVGFVGLRYDLKNDFEVYHAPWDWTRPIDQVWDRFLVPVINRAKKRTGWDKVHVVAHSMGGLVTRAYIESWDYSRRKDIDKLAMVGTPNWGAPLAYYMWEGGDPEYADTVKGLRDPITHISRFYCNTTNLLHKSYFPRGEGLYGWFCNDRKRPTSAIRQFYRDWVPSAEELMPVYDCPIEVKNGDGSLLRCLNSYNSRLRALNAQSQLSGRFTSEEGCSDSGCQDKVKTKLFLSEDVRDTVWRVNTEPNGGDAVYPEGVPSGQPDRGWGDGTVPAVGEDGNRIDFLSLLVDFFMIPELGGISAEVYSVGDHARMVGALRSEIVEFLTGTESPSATFRAPEVLVESAEPTPTPVLKLWVKGRVQPYLTAPDETSTGVNPANYATEELITGSSLDLLLQTSTIKVENPEDGTYTVELQGQHPGDLFLLGVGYDDGETWSEDVLSLLYEGGISTLTFGLDTAGVEPEIEFIPLVESPTDLAVIDNGASSNFAGPPHLTLP
ncbi:MAG: carboxypeptidase regulatory-like domain-containing protein [Gammaproteobacteria bacterium]|nr:carboxypeptidase regulatory-like domain-containing protein [Gammaproteobacteria bacterium]